MTIETDDLAMFRDSIAAYLRERYDDTVRRRISETEAGWSEAQWQAFAGELGLLGAAAPEEHGGLGGGAAAHGLIMEQFGTALVVEPYLSTAVIGGGFLRYGSLDDAFDLLNGIVNGTVRTAYAHGEPGTRYNLAHVETSARRDGDAYVIDGRKSVVLDAAAATHLIVIARTAGATREPFGISAFLIDVVTPGLTRRDFKTIAGGSASEIEFAAMRVPATALLTPEGEALPVIERVMDEATVAVCHEAVGVMTRLHADTLDYTRQRRQFGRALSEFQVLQHRMVDMLIALTHSRSIVARATEALDAPALERSRLVSAAKVYVGKAARMCGQQAIQLHGGMGMTDELPVGFFFKRAIEIERQFGNIDYHLTRYERLSFGANTERQMVPSFGLEGA